MALNLATNDYSSGMLEAGIYHFAIAGVKPDNSNLIVECKILAGTTPGQVGKTQNEYFNLSGKALNRLFALAIATGLKPIGEQAPLTSQRLQQLQAQGQPCNIDENQFIGRSFIGEIQMEKYVGQDPEKQDKSYPRLGFRIHSVYRSMDLGCPLDQANAQFMATVLPPPPVKPAAQAQTAQAAPAASQAAPVTQAAAPVAAAAGSFFS